MSRAGFELRDQGFQILKVASLEKHGRTMTWRLVTASQDGAVVLWDVDGMQNVITLRKVGGAPTSLTFSADGLTLTMSDDKGEIQVWQGAQPGF